MTRINQYFFLLVLVMLSIPAWGQNKVYDTLVLLNDASRVEGRIIVQHPGVDLVFLQDGKKTTYLLEDILAIERVTRSEDELSGIVDIIETKDGNTYKGQIVKQIMGKSIHLQEDNDSVHIRIIKNADIARQRREKFNQKQSLFAQSPFLDIVITEEKQYSGIIVLQDYGSDEVPSFLCVEDFDGEQHKVDIESIKKIKRESNSSYDPLMVFKVGEEDVFFNRTLATVVESSTDKNANFKIPCETLQAAFVSFVSGSPLVVEFKDIPANRQGVLIRATILNSGKKQFLSFSYQDMVLASINPVVTTSVKGTVRSEYPILPGYYVFFIPQDKRIYVCEVK